MGLGKLLILDGRKKDSLQYSLSCSVSGTSKEFCTETRESRLDSCRKYPTAVTQPASEDPSEVAGAGIPLVLSCFVGIASTPTRSLRLAPSSAISRDTLRRRTQREQNSKVSGSPVSPNSPLQLRPNEADAEIDEQIRQRAYELYQERGGMDGDPTDDWLQAKENVLGSKAKAATTSS
jgi:Protein of unknown function (DUF2934)